MAYGGKEVSPEQVRLRKKGTPSQARIRQMAKAFARHAAEREADPMRRLMALHELGDAVEKELKKPPASAVPADYYAQYDDYDPERAREEAIHEDYTFEELALYFLPVGRILGAGAKAVGRGWTFVKLSKPFRAVLEGYERFLGPKVERWVLSIRTPYQSKWALQRWTPAAFRLRRSVRAGGTVYKQGSFANAAKNFSGSDVATSQFLANEHPLVSSTYAARHGLYSPAKDWVISAEVKAGSKAIIRSAPPGPLGPGGAPEAVLEPNMIRIQWFHMP